MAKKLKVRRIGNSLGVILPKEVLEQLRVEEGDGLDYSASKTSPWELPSLVSFLCIGNTLYYTLPKSSRPP